MNAYKDLIRELVKNVPAVRPLLEDRTRWTLYTPAQYKTYEYMLGVIVRSVTNVYDGYLGGEFIDIMANLISGQFQQAYQQAMEDEGITDFILPENLQASLDNLILSQYDYVDQYYRDIIDARIDNTPLDPLLVRAELWANRYNEAYNTALREIQLQMGGKMEWILGATEAHCPTCDFLNGKVMYAREWEALDLHPQGAPNNHLACGGWNCDCSCPPTDKRRTPDAYGRIEEFLLSQT
jgi:hypothetical protein